MNTVFLLDTDFTIIKIVEDYSSLIWNERFQECGDFELYMQCSLDNLLAYTPGRYLIQNGTNYGMVIEDVRITTDSEIGDNLTITGRSFESLLSRRIIWSQTNITGSFQNGLKKLLNENLINPVNTDRKIPNFIFQDSTDSYITSLTLEAQYTGENLYEVVVASCAEAGIGFRVFLDSSNNFVFELYSGTDRSHNQSVNPHVTFSPKYDNLMSADYVEKTQQQVNVALIAGEGNGTAKQTTTVGEATGLSRKETYIDGSDISKSTDSGTMSNTEYEKKLKQKGNEQIAENNRSLVEFSCEIDAKKTFIYGNDFFLGDLVSVVSAYGIERVARILEYISSSDGTGSKTYPTFEILEA